MSACERDPLITQPDDPNSMLRQDMTTGSLTEQGEWALLANMPETSRLAEGDIHEVIVYLQGAGVQPSLDILGSDRNISEACLTIIGAAGIGTVQEEPVYCRALQVIEIERQEAGRTQAEIAIKELGPIYKNHPLIQMVDQLKAALEQLADQARQKAQIELIANRKPLGKAVGQVELETVGNAAAFKLQRLKPGVTVLNHNLLLLIKMASEQLD